MRLDYIVLIPALILSINYTDTEIISLVTQYINSVHAHDKVPTLADYEYFDGAGQERELDMQIVYCALHRWIDYEPWENKIWYEYPLCADYEQKAYAMRNKMPSLYYAWLRRKIPLSPKIEFINIEYNKTYDSYKVNAILNEIKVVFHLSGKKEAGHDSRVFLEKIDGKDVIGDLRERDIANYKKGSLDFLLEVGDPSKYEQK